MNPSKISRWLCVGALGIASVVGVSSMALGQTGRDRAQTPAPASAPGEVLNLNTASQEELERLPGVGPARARAILELREQVRRFNRVEDILRVRGIGRATFRDLRPILTLEGPTTLQGGSRTRTAPATE